MDYSGDLGLRVSPERLELRQGSQVTEGLQALNDTPCSALRRCLAHSRPHDLDDSRRMILRNMAELIVRELWGCYQHGHQQRILQLVGAHAFDLDLEPSPSPCAPMPPHAKRSESETLCGAGLPAAAATCGHVLAKLSLCEIS